MLMESIAFMNNQKAKLMNGLSNNRKIQMQEEIGLLASQVVQIPSISHIKMSVNLIC
jgi:hypothetical protein